MSSTYEDAVRRKEAEMVRTIKSVVKWAILGILVLFFLVKGLTSCTRVETGEVGLRKAFDGTVDMDPLNPGFHPTLISSVLIFSSREVLGELKDLHPVTRDKLPMQDVDVRFTYKVNPQSIPKLYTKYSATYHADVGGEIFVLRNFVEQFVRSAVADAIAKYPALEVNDHRPELVAAIQEDVQSKLNKEGLQSDITVGQIVFTNVSIPQVIVDSTGAVVKAQNEAKAAEFTANVARVSAQGTADAAVISAKGEGESRKQRAIGEAEAIRAQNAALQAQGGETYVKWLAVQKWDGVLPPQYAALPLPFVGTTTKGEK
jgi:regulator of protease activity HflC (stomatin/prohibitin superfamily)